MRRLRLPAGLPITYRHTSDEAVERQGFRGFEIGRVEDSWLDDEGWLVARGIVFTDTLHGRAAAVQMEHGIADGLSLTHEYELEPRITGDPGWFETKTFVELAIAPVGDLGREGCVALRGEPAEIEEDRERITAPGVAPPATTIPPSAKSNLMDPKEKAQLEAELLKERERSAKIVEELQSFTVASQKRDAEFEALQQALKEKDDREAALKGQLDGFFQARHAQVAEKQKQVAEMTSDPETAKTAFGELQALAQNPAQLDTIDRVFTLVADNMRSFTREDREAATQGYKSRLIAGMGADDLLEQNRKRWRTSSGAAAAPASTSVDTTKISRRDLALAQVAQRGVVYGGQL